MNQSLPRRPLPSGVRSDKSPRTVCVVDPRPEDYSGWAELAQSQGFELRFLTTAAEALRQVRARHVSLWVINAELPNLSGDELCGMLKAQSPQTPVYLVADQYSPQAEIAALRSRATVFGCKGAHGNWLAQWAEQFAPRASSAPSHTEVHAVQ